MAVTVETGAPEQVAGYVQPGSQVAIFLTYTVLDSNGTKTNIERTRVLLPRVEVLAVGTYQPSRNGTAPTVRQRHRASSLLLTVAVNQAEAERLIEGLSHGTPLPRSAHRLGRGKTGHGRRQHRRRRRHRAALQSDRLKTSRTEN